MGCRLHAATRWDVEWGSYAAFNWQQDEVFKELRDADIDLYDCDFDNPYPEDFSVSVKSMDEYIEKLLSSDKVEDVDRGCEWKELLNKATKEDGYYHLSWF